MNDNAPPAARLVPVIGTIGPDDVVTFDDTPAARAFLERARRATADAAPRPPLRLVEGEP